MAVLVTADFAPPAHGGIERYMLHLAAALVEAGREVVMVAPEMPGAHAFDTTLPYRVLRFPFAGHGKEAPFKTVLAMRRATALAHELAADRCTIASSWIRAGAACALLSRSIRGRTAILAHGSEVLAQNSLPKKMLMRSVFACADAIVANSAFTAGILREKGIRRPVTIAPCGVEPRDAVRNPSPAPTVLSVGRLVRRKGYDRTMQAVAQLAASIPNLVYEIAGAGPDEEYLRGLARELQIADRVRFLGRVSDEELVQAYARAWCFALPTRRVGSDVEGFGIVYLEAAVAGIPAIGGAGCGADDAIEDGRSGLLVNGDDAGEIASALQALLCDTAAAQAMGAYGRTRALTRFSWARTAQTIMSALEEDGREKAGALARGRGPA